MSKNCIKIWSLILHDVLLLHYWERGYLARIHNLKAWHQSKGRLIGAKRKTNETTFKNLITMKKLFSLFVPLMALFLTLAPQTARGAAYYKADPTTNTELKNAIKIRNVATSSSNSSFSVVIQLIGTWSTTDMDNLNLKICKSNQNSSGKYYSGTSSSNTTPSWTNLTNKSFTSKTGGYVYSIGALYYNYAYGSNVNAVAIQMNPTNITFSKEKHVQICIHSNGTYQQYEVSGDIMSMVYGANCTSNPNYTVIPQDYQFYQFFTSYNMNVTSNQRGTGGSNTTNYDYSNLILPATTLRRGCYEEMFSEVYLTAAGTKTMAGPQIRAFSLKDDCGNAIEDCCKNMFNGNGYLASLTAYFMEWGDTPSNVPTYNWITSTQDLTFNCPSTLTETKDANHMGTNGTKSATANPDVYVFNVSDNGFTWDGTCNSNKYYTSSVPSNLTPHEAGFDGWYSEELNKLTLSDLPSPSGIITIYAERTGSVTVPYTITFKSDDGTTLEAKSCRPGHVPTFTGNVNKLGYIFTGWSPAIVAATADATYTATYIQEPDYFTITNRHASQKLTAALRYGSNVPTHVTLKYRIISKESVVGDWQDYNSSTAGNGTSRTIADIPAGAKLQLYGTNTSGFGQSKMNRWALTLAGSGEAVLSGELMSVFSGTETEIDITRTLPSFAFCNFFYDINAENTRIFSAKDLKLSATNLGTDCYFQMFYECSNMVEAPLILPATTLTTECYMSMFSNCKALTTTPALPATTLASSCYYNMFKGCTSLVTAPALPAMTLETSCYNGMFTGCSSLVNVQNELPATVLPPLCYNAMFKNCTSLVKAPEIAGTSMSSGNNQQCYEMFSGCTSLTQAPSKLEVSSLKVSCYYHMFSYCSNLENAPDIYATSYANTALAYIFYQCTKLKKIRIYFTGSTLSQCGDWTYNVPQTGDFYCPPTLNRTYGTSNAIPYSSTYPWAVFSYNITFVPKSCSWTDETNANKQFTWETDTTNVMTFLRAESADNAKFYTDAACTSEISVSDIAAALATQQEASTATTMNYYVQKVSSYTLDWDANGGELSGDYTAAGSYSAGAAIKAPTATRTGYTFDVWDPAFTGTMPAANTTYTAQWTKATTLDLYDDRGAAYYNNIKALDGQTYDVTYHRSVKYESDGGSARWYTLCLPFNVDQSQLDLNGLTGKVYEYRYAEGSADENDHVTFHFRAVKSPGYMHAGQGYLVKATGNMGPDFTFENVTLNTSADVENGNVDNLKNSNAYKESGDIAIVGVLRNGTLSAAGKQVMGLANNKIWYPHSSGNPMPAYRAYFYNPNASASSVMPRVRIVVEGEGTTELEVVDGELYDAGGDVRAPSGAARKYIRNGVLIIERNGERYNAQGARM